MIITFQDLWAAYPADNSPCQNAQGHSNFDNQCAIRMSVCLLEAGLDLSPCTAVRCWFGHGRKHVLRAQQLADWLATPAPLTSLGVSKVEKYRNVTHTKFLGRPGIVFFQNFWGRGNQGDHIDLWDGESVRTGAVDYFSRSQRVWFWSVAQYAVPPLGYWVA